MWVLLMLNAKMVVCYEFITHLNDFNILLFLNIVNSCIIKMFVFEIRYFIFIKIMHNLNYLNTFS